MYAYQLFIFAAFEKLTLMKKVFVLGTLALIGLSSCKKDWTCTCEVNSFGITVSGSSTIENATRSDAKEACDEGDYVTSVATSECSIN